MRFSEMLAKFRSAAGLTQAALSKKSGIPLRTLQDWEQGRSGPVSPVFFKLTKALGIPADAFAGITDKTNGRSTAKGKK
jgi:transcriptional regulator with XRE-family HTH domain